MRATGLAGSIFSGIQRIAVAVFVLCLVPVAAHAQPANVDTAKEFVSALSSQGIAILADKSLSQDEQTARFRQLLKSDVDIPRLARFTLGRYWRVATPAERAEFLRLFEEWILSTYVGRLGNYSGQTITVSTARPETETLVLVRSIVNQPNGAPPVGVDWRIWVANGRGKLVDVVVEGVSMATTLQSQFISIIQNNGGRVSALLDRMRTTVGSSATSGS